MSSLDGKSAEEIQKIAFKVSSNEFSKEYLLSLTENCFDVCFKSMNINCVQSCALKFKKSYSIASQILTEKKFSASRLDETRNSLLIDKRDPLD
eukprot:gene4352-7708_t